MNDINQQIKEYFDALSPSLQKSIALSSWTKSVRKMGEMLNFDEQKINDLETEALLVLYGIENSEDFTQNIVNEIGLEADLAKQVASEIENSIFLPILEKAAENSSNKEGAVSLPTASPEELLLPEHATPEPEGSNAPPPLEIKNEPAPEVRIAKPSYPAGIDPYREPLE